MLDWNDLRYFLAVARAGSTLAASKQLKVSQATVSRRIMALEQTIGVEIFSRKPSGYSLTQRGELLMPAAEAVEESVLAFSDKVAFETRRVSGTVRLTTVESAANAWVIPALAQLRARFPDVRVEIITTDDNLDLARGEADLAIRFGNKPVAEALVVRHLTDMEESFYASHELVARLGLPEAPGDLARYPLVTSTDDGGMINSWILANLPDAEIAHRANRLSSIIAGVRAGMGASILPCLMGDDIRGLVRLGPPIAELRTPGWMVTTDQARRQPHVRAVIDFIVGQIQEWLARRSSLSELERAA
jgi:DNA-binding transcriptional LysR family regulator